MVQLRCLKPAVDSGLTNPPASLIHILGGSRWAGRLGACGYSDRVKSCKRPCTFRPRGLSGGGGDAPRTKASRLISSWRAIASTREKRGSAILLSSIIFIVFLLTPI